MDYERIYRELIADRRANPPAEEEYVEVHHILPRCMGGGNEPENLIRLRPEDHYFAHLVLAHIHRSRELWSAVVLMSGNRYAELRRSRKTYGLARRKLNEVSRGLDAPRADTNEYTFYHIDGDVFTGTRIDFGAYADIPEPSVNPLVRGEHRIAYGWALSPIDKDEYATQRSDRAKRSGKMLRGFIRDKKLYSFYNRDLDISALATQAGMQSMFGLSASGVSALVKGGRHVSSGWCLLDAAETAYDDGRPSGERSPSYNPTVHSFVNDITGERRCATQHEMGKLFNDGDGRPFGELAMGRKGGFRGWRLAASKPARVQGLRHTLYKNGRSISGTQRELMATVGVTQVAISNVVRGKKMHTRGWMLRPANDNVQPDMFGYAA